MKADEIIKLAKEMRAAQKRYFAGARDELPACRELERRLDQALKDHEGGQGKLFDSAEGITP